MDLIGPGAPSSLWHAPFTILRGGNVEKHCPGWQTKLRTCLWSYGGGEVGAQRAPQPSAIYPPGVGGGTSSCLKHQSILSNQGFVHSSHKVALLHCLSSDLSTSLHLYSNGSKTFLIQQHTGSVFGHVPPFTYT